MARFITTGQLFKSGGKWWVDIKNSVIYRVDASISNYERREVTVRVNTDDQFAEIIPDCIIPLHD